MAVTDNEILAFCGVSGDMIEDSGHETDGPMTKA